MKRSGSITVFCSLALMLVASFLLALLEAGRVYGLEVRADQVTELGIESVGAEYQPTLWEEYHLLCLDGAYGGETFSMDTIGSVFHKKMDRNLDRAGTSADLLGLSVSDVAVQQYELLTDANGSVFLGYIADIRKKEIATSVVSSLYGSYMQQKQVDEADVESTIESASSALESAKEAERQAATEEEREVTYTQTVENPLEVALAVKRNAVLGMVVEDVGALSSHAIDLSGSLSRRTRTQGTSGAQTAAVSAADRIVAIDYLEEYFWNYTNASTDRPLAYEMEYALCGKETDQANLEGVIDRLLLLRESSNVIHIMGDAEKVALANSIATALAGFTLNPAIIKAVEVGIIGAWAYLESVQDVRALLQGDKIALLKTKDQWTVDLAHLSSSFQATAKAKSCENGLTYQQYLKGFLYLEGDAMLAYRMMDLMEKRIQTAEGTAYFKADHMLTQMTYVCTYRGTPLFSELAVIGHLSTKQYQFSSKKKFEYHTT